MSTSGALIFGSLFVLLFLVLIPVLVGIYVFRDARRRGMNAALWTVIAILVPGLIGFVIYLLVRGSYSDLRCPRCETPVQESFMVCPSCGARLRPSCPGCGMAVEQGWKVCPHCAQPLPPQQQVTPPVHAKDQSLGKILAIVILVPLILLLLVLGLSLSATGGGSAGMLGVTRDDYFDTQPSGEIAGEVERWLAQVESDNRLDEAYALQYSEPEGEDRTCYRYLVYVPAGTGGGSSSLGISQSIFGTTLNLELTATGDAGALYNVTTTLENGRSRVQLKLRLDGEKLHTHVTQVDYDPTILTVYQG